MSKKVHAGSRRDRPRWRSLGAGISGLSAAHRLSHRHRVELLEGGRPANVSEGFRPGGRRWRERENAVRGLWRRRVGEPVTALLRQGLTPEGIALSLAFGLAAGIFPVIGATTLLGLAVGATLRLNQPALHLANWLAYPLQVLLIIPLVRLGEWLAGAPPASFTVSHVAARVVADPVDAVGAFGMIGLHGILGWLAVLPLVVLGLYRVLLPALRAAQLRIQFAAAPASRCRRRSPVRWSQGVDREPGGGGPGAINLLSIPEE